MTQLDGKHDDYKWVRPDDLPTYELVVGMPEIFTKTLAEYNRS